MPSDVPKGDGCRRRSAAASLRLPTRFAKGMRRAPKRRRPSGYRCAGLVRACKSDDELTAVTPLLVRRRSRRARAFVDHQHDVTVADDRALAAREGFNSVELLKRYTTLGHGHRSGQHIERQRPGDSGRRDRAIDSGGGHDGVSSAIDAGRRSARS